MNNILNIERTGGKNGDFLFNHLVLSEKELREVESIEELAEKHDIDFISVERNNSINYYHVTDIDNYESINEKGLLYNQNNEWVGDLGKGIYAVEQGNHIAIDNLQSYVAELVGGDDILIVEGVYTGIYTECIYGYGHEGYIVFKGNTDNIIDLIDCEVNDFLLDY